MRRIVFLLLLLASPVLAQQAQPTVEDLRAQYLFETGQLRQALGEAQAQIIQLRRENADLKTKGEQKPPSDAIGVPSPGGGVQMKMQEPKK